jgi:uncharacterized oligopeptide transporter (OPT) family protein
MRGWLPPLGSRRYHLFLAAIAVFILGPLGGVTAAYMNFSLGFFVGGQVLAGILGSVVTLSYGPEGKHGANYMQTMAASVASMAAMGVLIQAMVWLGMPAPPTWQLILYFLCIGMFGVGVGMLYTPILVDKLQLTYPSGLAVANILRALTDTAILRRSVAQLGGGIGVGLVLSKVVEKLAGAYEEASAAAKAAAIKMSTAQTWAWDAATTFSAATFGGGMIVGARISASAIVVGAVGVYLTPWLRENGYLGEHDPFRKIGFVFALGMILGAAVIDMALLAFSATQRVKESRTTTTQATPVARLVVWVVVWGVLLVITSTQILHVPVQWVLLAILLAFIFLMINGISQGITDQNPISSAFVVSVLVMAAGGLRDPIVGVLAGSILLVACTVGVDMQQDRSTGARLGSDRTIQFRYQMIGVVMGAILAVVMTRVFLEAYPVLKENLFLHPEIRETPEGAKWQSAMTYKFVGVLSNLAADNSRILSVMMKGFGLGLIIQGVRKILQKNTAYQAWRKKNAVNATTDFILDALVLASPYASSFGGFVDFTTSLWFGLGGIFASVFGWLEVRRRKNATTDMPDDMSTMSLVGGGLIAGESLYALFIGIVSLITTGALWKVFG